MWHHLYENESNRIFPSGSYCKKDNSDLVFQTCNFFLKMCKFIACRDQTVIFKIMNYLFLETNFVRKLQGKCWKDDVVSVTATLSITIKCLTRYKQKVILATMLEGKSMPSKMASNTNHTTLLKKSKCHKNISLSNLGCKIIWVFLGVAETIVC